MSSRLSRPGLTAGRRTLQRAASSTQASSSRVSTAVREAPHCRSCRWADRGDRRVVEAHRLDARLLFRRELGEAIEQIENDPLFGTIYRGRTKAYRRILMPKTR